MHHHTKHPVTHLLACLGVLVFLILAVVSGQSFAAESESTDSAEPSTGSSAESMPMSSEEQDLELPFASGLYYVHCITSPYVFFATPEVEASNIPLIAREGEDAARYQDENGEGLVNNLQLEILGEDLVPLQIEFDQDGSAFFVIPETGKVLGLAGGLRDGVNILPVERVTSSRPGPGRDKIDQLMAKNAQRWILDQQEDGTYVIRNAANPHYVMTVDDRFGTQYANIMLWEDTGAETQRFRILSETPTVPKTVEEGTYFIRTGLSDWFVLSIGNGIYNDERNIYLWESDQGDGQMFTVEYDDYGFAILHHNDSSKVLTVRNNVARNGQEIGQLEYDGNLWQRWIIEEREDGGYYLRSALNVSEVMELPNSVIRNGTPILLHWHNGSQAQQWFFHSDPVPSPPYAQIMNDYAQSRSSATGFLIMIDTSSNHLGVYQGYYGNWTNLFFWDCVTGKSWTPTPLGEFPIFNHLYSFDGNEDSPVWYSVYYASEFLPTYYIHSIIYYQGTWDILDASMGVNASHGCVRLYTDNAAWIYNNIPGGTNVVIY